jgi:hypothetical protein
VARYEETYKDVEYTIDTIQIGKRWRWELSVGDENLDSGTATIEPEAAAYAEAKAKAKAIISKT